METEQTREKAGENERRCYKSVSFFFFRLSLVLCPERDLSGSNDLEVNEITQLITPVRSLTSIPPARSVE